ncbi:glycosyltransferase family 1 protein [[Candida] arabinofermentans NRRL YB-2248]|uniref:UDP-N-acetylglucosamine transferase subunit ALG14 n=1 Tax=[Candida] arabinofermentans NRRL YB-2248 TaxID=983967 RepID=A0A1E4SST9_9ASCO|nr:glycosyltransferase family 1 protein [[Candida] arabinofermentans NRRL YB-2248]
MEESTYTIISAFVLIPLIVLILRIIWVLPACYTSASHTDKPLFHIPNTGKQLEMMILLGSGGHTGEMIRILSQFKSIEKLHRRYVISSGDQTSLLNISKSEQNGQDNGRNTDLIEYMILPRARLIGENKISAIFRTSYSFVITVVNLLKLKNEGFPDLLLCNGPGTAVPIAYTLFGLKVIGLCKTKIVYVESLARVNKLSLTGLMLLPIANRMIVQWEQLALKYNRCEYHGILV